MHKPFVDSSLVVTKAREAGVRYVRLFFADVLGASKCVVIPVSDLEKALAGEVTFDGGSINGFVRDQEIDMILRPDPSTFALLPQPEGTPLEARLICDIAMPDGEPFEGCPRTTLRRILDNASDVLPRLRTAIEVEFYLFEALVDDVPQTYDAASYFDISVIDRGETVRTAIVAALEGMGIAIAAAHHEHAPGQHEIDLGETGVLAAADQLLTMRLIAKQTAARFGMHATFMPKPLENSAGSGLHFYFHWGTDKTRDDTVKSANNVEIAMPDPEFDAASYARDEEMDFDAQELQAFLHDRRDELDERLYGVGGLLAHAPACTAICNPLVNSYKRLVTEWDAPVFTVWSHRSANALVRVPNDPKCAKLEMRSPDPACNPYLALGVLVASIVDGFRTKLLPGDPLVGNTYGLTDDEKVERGIRHLPKSLRQALAELANDTVIRNALGDHIYHAFHDAKRREYESYRRAVHPWERKTYIRRY